jgi:hypothetical protein
MAQANKIHLNDKDNAYKTEALAREAQGALSVATEIVPFGNGFALRETGKEKPAGTTQTDSAQTERPKESRTAARPDRNAVLSAKRERRKELGARDPLEAYKIPGMVTRWVRDTEREGGRKIHQKLKKGWDFVELCDGVPTAVQGDVGRGAISDRYVTMPGGNGAVMYLMAIEQELFQEDREESKEAQDRKIEQMRKSAMHPDIEGTGLRMSVTTPAPR